MPQSAWNAKRERQYEHIEESAKKQGRSAKRAKEIAARTVNKERARSGETKGRASRTSTRDMSSGRRGGLRSGTKRPKGRTKEQLYNEAKRKNVPGRSSMTKAQLQRAVDAPQVGTDSGVPGRGRAGLARTAGATRPREPRDR